jgi:hypothetical protein
MAKASAETVFNARRTRTAEYIATYKPIALRMALMENALFTNFLAQISTALSSILQKLGKHPTEKEFMKIVGRSQRLFFA